MIETLLLTIGTNHEHGKSNAGRLSVRTVRSQMVSTPRHQERTTSLPQMQEPLLERSKEGEALMAQTTLEKTGKFQ
jgi:hypothetical protein